MEDINKYIEQLIKNKYSDLQIKSTKNQIEISKSYFKVILSLRNSKTNKSHFDIFVYSGLLGYLFNKNLSAEVVNLKADLEKIILENGFEYKYLNRMI